MAASGTSPASTTPKISAGREGHALGLKSDGTVWGWGQNFEGQLGDGTTAHRNTPVQASGMSDAIAVAAGAYHSLALKSDGTVWAWGDNNYGQLGDGTTSDRNIPVQVSGLSGVTAIAAGYRHTVALKSDGTVWAWGNNYYGQLGDGTNTDRNTPLQLSSLSSVTAIACGKNYSLAMKSDGTVWAWGYNGNGQLGDGTYTDRNTPVQVSGLSGVIAIAGGGNHSLALKSDGTVWACGWNALGQLGDGTTNADRNTPVQVNGLSGAIAVSAGESHSLALKSDGTVWVWGRNDNGELGNGANTSKNTPVQVNSLSGIVAISGGAIIGSGYSLALKSDGTVWAWGRGDYGQLGDGTNTDKNTPVQVSGLNLGSTTITATPTPTPSPASSPTATPSPTATSTPTPSSTPTPTSPASTTPQISSGSRHTVALKSDGTVWAWGYNDYGQCGIPNDYSKSGENIPVKVSSLSNVTAVAGGGYHSLALKSDGTVWAWGANSSGQLGDGTTTNRNTPVQVSGLSDVVAIAGGGYHSLALKSDGTVWAWGKDNAGQIGDGGTFGSGEYRKTPVQVFNLSKVTVIAGGESHSLALKSDGTVWFWGDDYGPTTGTTYVSTSTPVQVSSLTNVTAIVGGKSHSLALKSDGTVWAWGDNGWGQLGNGTYTDADRDAPVQVSSLSNGIDIAAGHNHSLSLKSDGSVWSWGNNEYGELGDGTNTQKTTPVQVSDLNLYSTTTTTPTPTPSATATSTPTPKSSPTPSSTPSSEKGSISGDVTDTEGDPIESAKISLKGKQTKVSKSTTSDEDGYFEFTDLDADTYTITATRKGYKKGKQVVTLGQGEDANIEIEMKKTKSRKILPGEEDPDVIESVSH